MNKYFNVILILSVVFIYSGCGSNYGTDPDPENPVPTLSSISPESKVSHLPDFTLTVTGTNYVSGSKIIFHGTEKITTFLKNTELTCQISSADITTDASFISNPEVLKGILNKNVSVSVRNPSPGGGDSNSLSFNIKDNHTFNAPRNIYTNSDPYFKSKIAIDSSGYIFVAWENNTTGKDDIYFTRSTDNGASWSSAVNISKSVQYSNYPAIAADNSGNIYLVWYEYAFSPGNFGIFFARSTDSGASWSNPVFISQNGRAALPAMAVDKSGNIYIVWENFPTNEGDIFFTRSSDKGDSWSSPVNISNSEMESYRSAVAVDSAGNINVIWSDLATGVSDIYYIRSTDNGAGWSSPVNISNSLEDSLWPAIAVNGSGNISVAWHEITSGQNDIYFTRSTNEGISWSSVLNLSNNLNGSSEPAIAVDRAGNINVVWCDYTSGKGDIFFSRFTGAGWSPVINVSKSSEGSFKQAVAVDRAGNVFMVWCDGSSGNDDLYFSSSIH